MRVWWSNTWLFFKFPPWKDLWCSLHSVIRLIDDGSWWLVTLSFICRTIPFGWNLITSGYFELSVYGVLCLCFNLFLSNPHFAWVITACKCCRLSSAPFLSSLWESFWSLSGVPRSSLSSSSSWTSLPISVFSSQPLLCTTLPGSKSTCEYSLTPFTC